MNIMDMENAIPADKNVAPMLMVEQGAELRCLYFADSEAAILAIRAAEILDFGYRLDCYSAPPNDTDTQREWRVLVWRDLCSDAAFMPREEAAVPSPEPSGPKGNDK